MASELPPNALGKLASSVKNIVTGVPLEDQNETNAPATKQVDKSLDKTVDKTVETTDDATIHKEKQAPVVHEDVKSHEHEKVDTEVDHEVHQDHYHTTIQPVKDKNVLPTKHVYKENEVEEEIDHRNNEAKMKAKEEAARIKNEKNVEDTTHSREYAPTKEHEHIHHHLHENIQPVIERETVQQKVIHTTNHIHEKEQLNDEYHEATVAPAISLDEFKNGGAKTGTTVTKDIEMPVSGVKATAKKREALGDVDVEEASRVAGSAVVNSLYIATASYWKKTFLPHDISEQSVIGVWLKGTSYEDLLHIWGIFRAAYTAQLILLRMTDPSVAHELLTAAGAAALVHDPCLASVLQDSTSKLTPVGPLPKMMDGDQILMIYHTSGSTSGAPKLVPITARWMECLIKKFSSLSEFLPLPRTMVKVAITMLFLESDLQDGCFIIPTSIPYPTSELVDMIDNHGLTRLDMFPVFLSQLFRQARHDPLLFRSLCLLDHIAYGGYPLDPYEEAWAHGHKFYLISAFGFTEVGLNLISYGAKEVALGPVSPSIFEFVPLGDDQNAQEHLVELVVPPESPDCPHYSLRDAADGKFHTGDLLLEIALGEYAFRGRDDDWIKMEMALRCDANSIEVDALQCCGDDLIHAVVAIGVGRPSPAIVLEPKHDDVLESTEKTRELQLKVLQRITPFHRRRYKHERIKDVNLIFVVPQRSLPRTDTKGNIRRLKVEEQFKQKLDEMFK
ncbi:hypothetical protein BKA60DRAFT_608762 [Fusarium oxysporum]|nr:hypothetical protein BKA60DRAFT_608762 [Fusarium oxysporum]